MARVRAKTEADTQRLLDRVQQPTTMADVADKLSEHYRGLDQQPRREFMRTALKMFANYENKWSGDVNLITGTWMDSRKSAVDVDFTVPLLTDIVDTHITFYTKTRPKYIARMLDRSSLAKRTAKMCQEIAQGELDRMLRASHLQREALYMALATVSYRRLEPAIMPHSPSVEVNDTQEQEIPYAKMDCPTCGHQEMMEGEQPESPMMESQEPQEPQGPAPTQMPPRCPTCLSPMGKSYGSQTQQVPVQTNVKLPRLKLSIPNPVYIQTDFNATDFPEAKFVVKRKSIAKKTAEFYYGISFAPTGLSEESQVEERKAREPLTDAWEIPMIADGIGRGERVDEIEIWAEPCEYGLNTVDGQLLASQYPEGLYMKIVGDILVEQRAAVKNDEFIRVQQGVRPAANTGMGMVHIADMNDLVNNEISLEYAILMSYGFPIQLLRGKYLKELPAALQTFIVEKIPDTMGLDDLIHREQPTNTSGMLGILSQRVEGYMERISGTFAQGGITPQSKQMMGTATGASAIQEMMSDRMGLASQMRVEADIQTMNSILRFFRKEELNKQWLLSCGYDEVTIDNFYSGDLDSMFYFEAAAGSDEPKLDSVNTFKAMTFAQTVAPLTGLRQADGPMFYDIVQQIGEALNIPTSAGAGRKEKNLADNRIDRVLELYRTEKDQEEAAAMDPVTLGTSLFKAVMLKEQSMISSIIQSQVQANVTAQPKTPEEAQAMQQEMQQMAMNVEIYLYDYDAMQDAYSDWLQSDKGQSADMPVQLAIGLLFAHALDMKDKRVQMEQAKALQMAGAATAVTGDPAATQGAEGDPTNPPGPAKRDGRSGPGRPHDIHPPSTPGEYQ